MNKMMLTTALGLALAACSTSGAADKVSGSSSTSPVSSAPKTTATPPAETAAASATTLAPPADPLDESGSPQASCDQIKAGGTCTEHYDLGMAGDVDKNVCEGGSGKWEKDKPCPKEGRVTVCLTDTKRMFHYKSYPWGGNGKAEVEKLCTGGMLGKFAELAKK